MTSKLTTKLMVVCLVVFTFVFFVTELQARRFGGGGKGISRGGVASHGGFSGHGMRGGGRGINRDLGRGVNRGAGRGVNRDFGRGIDRDIGRGIDRDFDRDFDRADNLRDRQDDRQDFIEDERDDRRDFLEDRQDDRQDFVDDELDDWDRCCFDNDGGEFLAGALVGGAIGAAVSNDTTYIVNLPCTATPIPYAGASYYNCSGTWYQKSYAGGDIVYVVTSAPPGFY